MNNVLVSTNAQIVLEFIAAEPGRQFIAGDIQRATRVSRAGVNFALRKLVKEKLALREKKANLYFYSVDTANPVIKQKKILGNTVSLMPLLAKLKPVSEKIILFGSCSRGENTPQSDIDLLIISNNPEEVKESIAKFKKLQPLIKTPVQYAELKKNDPVFYAEISRGIVLWEKRE